MVYFRNIETNTNENSQTIGAPTENSIGQHRLFRVLKAISNYFPSFGYTQGMNLIVGFCLIINGGIEEEAFWFFVSLAKSEKYLLTGLFENEFPLVDISKYIFN